MKNILIKTLLISSLIATPAIANESDTSSKKQEKIQKMQEHFAKVDSDGSGTISKAEFIAQAEEKFAKIDTDGNGEISKEESKAMREKWREHFKNKRKDAIDG